ncbi:MAG: CBS domain-containing protein [Nitrospinae bacterium]|nr:CBS domain-containing protein [Nitrospinota bacterium]
MITVKKIMTPNVYSLSQDTTIRKASKLMKEKNIGSLYIKENDKLIGVVTETDIVRKGVADNIDMDSASLGDIMSSPIYTIDINKTVTEANEMMDKHKVRHLAVKEGENIVGVISARDLLHPIYLDGEGW